MHKNADLDALASAYYLSRIFGGADLAADSLDRFSKYMVKKFGINVKFDADENSYDEIIVVDTASREQLGKFRDFRIDAVYDHHASNDILADVRVVKPSYPSCSEMLYDIFGKVENEIAYVLLMGGIITDTRWFRHANGGTFRIVSRLIEDSGIEYGKIAEIFDFPYVQSEKVAILKGMQRLKFRTKGRKIVAYTIVGAHESSVATLLSSIADAIFVASARGDEVRITGRSREINLLEVYHDVSVAFGCKYGGHKNAAGMTCIGDPEAVLNALAIECEKRL